MTRRYPDSLELARTAHDIVRIHGEGKIASMIGLEGRKEATASKSRSVFHNGIMLLALGM